MPYPRPCSGCVRRQERIDAAKAEVAELRERLANLEVFKTYVHQRLDDIGVPHDPAPERTKETGCRIGERLSYLTAQLANAEKERDARPDMSIDGSGLVSYNNGIPNENEFNFTN